LRRRISTRPPVLLPALNACRSSPAIHDATAVDVVHHLGPFFGGFAVGEIEAERVEPQLAFLFVGTVTGEAVGF